MTAAGRAAPPTATPDPRIVWDLVQGFTAYWTVVAAVRLGVFDALAAGPAAVDALAPRLGADPDRLEVLVDALVGLELLTRDGDRYASTPACDALLVGDRPGSMRDLLLASPGPYENWPVLDVTVRSGAPATPLDDDESGAFYARLVRATFPTQHTVATRVAALLRERGVRPRLVVDLGAGAAPWSIALLEAFDGARAVVNELPAVAPLAAERLEQHGLAERSSLLPGDYGRVELPTGAGVVVLGHVLRNEGADAAKALVARAVASLAAGGVLVVADYFLDDDRRGPRNALLLGVTMAASTRHGRTFTRAAVRGWLEDAGLRGVELVEPVPFQQVMIARMPSAPGEGGEG